MKDINSTEIWTGYFNLLKTIMGAGIVSYPLFFVEFGLVSATVLSCLSSILAFSSLMILCECADFAETRDKTFSGALSSIFPGIAGMFNCIVFTKCFGVSVSYLVLLKPLLKDLLKKTDIRVLKDLSEYSIVVIYAILMFPICSMKDLKSLRYTSIIGVIGVCVCIVGSIYNYTVIRSSGNPMPDTSLVKYPAYSWLGFTGQFVFSFTCHQNIFGIRANLSDGSSGNMRYIILMGIGTSLFLYVLFGSVIYLSYGSKIEDNVFNSFIDGSVRSIVFVFYSIFISCSFPLQVHPARDCLTGWIDRMVQSLNIRRTESSKSKDNIAIRVFSTGIIILFCAILSLMPIELSTIQTVIGGSASTIMCNIIPALCIMKLPRSKSLFEKVSSISLIGYGVLAFTGIFIKIASKK